MGAPFRIVVVCTGNTCRSPMTERVLADALISADLPAPWVTSSLGTRANPAGSPIDPRAADALRRRGVTVDETHLARLVGAESVQHSDLLVALDRTHAERLIELGASRAQVVLLGAYDSMPDAPTDVADPFTGEQADYDFTLERIVRSVPGLVAEIRTRMTR